MMTNNEVIISADSHVQEKSDLWQTRVPSSYRDQVPPFPERREGMKHHPGGHDPHERIKEMEVDGLSAEVLYPTRCLKLYGVDEPGLQEACFRVYNDWIIDYCQVDSEATGRCSCYFRLQRRTCNSGTGAVHEGGAEGSSDLAGTAF